MAVIAPYYSFRFGGRLRVSGIISGEFEENILKAEAHAFQLEKRPAFLDDSCRYRAANIFALSSLNRGQNVTRQRCRFNLHAAGARNLREHFAERLLGRLHLHADTLPAL